MSTSSSNKKLTLKSSDNVEFEVEESVAVQAGLIKFLVEDDYSNSIIPLPNVTGEILALVIEYLKKHADSTVSEDDLKKFDSEFFDKPTLDLVHLVLAANYLNIKDLLDILCQKISENIKEKSVEEVREMLKIKNDFTKEEEAELRKEHAWAFE